METWFLFVFQCLHSNSLSGVCISSKPSIFAFITSHMAIATFNKLIACFPISWSLNINNIVGVWLNQFLATQWKVNKTSTVGSLKRISQFQTILNKTSSILNKGHGQEFNMHMLRFGFSFWWAWSWGQMLMRYSHHWGEYLLTITSPNQPPHPALLCKAVSNAAYYDEQGSSETQYLVHWIRIRELEGLRWTLMF